MQTTEAYEKRRALLMAQASRIVTEEDDAQMEGGDDTYLGLSLTFLASEIEEEMAMLESAITMLNARNCKD